MIFYLKSATHLYFQGIAFKSKRCALCRAEIPLAFLENPKLLKPCEELLEETTESEGSWFYEGRQGGWWMFDKRTNLEIEENWKKEKKNCVVLIAGFCYVIDFENLLQIRQNDPLRQRKIKRDVPNAPRKGIAGLRMLNNLQDTKTDESNTVAPSEAQENATVSTSNFVVDENEPGTSNAHQLETGNLDINAETGTDDLVDQLSEIITQKLNLSDHELEM